MKRKLNYKQPTVVSNKDEQKFSFTNYSDRFDEHISNSIRGYSTLKDDVVLISKYFIEDDTTF